MAISGAHVGARPWLYFGHKFEAGENRLEVEEQAELLSRELIANTLIYTRDVERWERFESDPRALALGCQQLIDVSDAVFVEVSQRGVGLGVETGYAAARGVPIIALRSAHEDEELSHNLRGCVTDILYYSTMEDIASQLRIKMYGWPFAATWPCQRALNNFNVHEGPCKSRGAIPRRPKNGGTILPFDPGKLESSIESIFRAARRSPTETRVTAEIATLLIERGRLRTSADVRWFINMQRNKPNPWPWDYESSTSYQASEDVA